MYSDKLVRGPTTEELGYKQSNDSFGKIMFDSLKRHDQNQIVVMDAITKETVTYGEMMLQSVQMAMGLQKLGVCKDDVVGIVSENSIRYPIPVVAAWYIGAIISPINNSYKKREIKTAFDISKPKVVFVSEANIDSIIELKHEVDYIKHVIAFNGSCVPDIHNFDEILKTAVKTNDFQPIEVDVENQGAAILCSSGTTGLPKAALLTHRNFINTLPSGKHPSMLGIKNGDSCVAILPFYHSFGILMCVGGIEFGMKLVVLAKFIPDVFLKTIEEFAITRLIVVPPLALFLAKSPMVAQYDLSSVTGLLCSSAPLGSEVQQALKNRINVKIQQAYGMTETCGLVTATNTCSTISKVGSSGTLVNDVECKVVDVETREKLGPNERGEICCKSPKNMREYVGNKQATFDAYDDEGFLLTGDIGYYDEDGYFYIVDRLKELIKYKGFQVSPVELEEILISHQGVKEAAVIGIPDERSGELPRAYVVKQPGSTITEEELIKYVADHVSISKQLHGGVKFIDEIPKNPTGKNLKRKLKENLT